MVAVRGNTEPEARVAKTSPKGRRIAARLLDSLVLIAIIVPLHRLLGGTTWLAVSLWVTVAYFFLLESTFGQTVGKNAVGIRVVRRDGGPPEANAIAVRNVVRVIEEPLIALIALFGSGRRSQRFGDLFAGTTVGVERASVRPHGSHLQLVYPVLWAVLGAAFVLTVHPSHPPTLGSLPGTIGGNTPTARAAATGKYLTNLQTLCRARDREIAEHPRLPIDAIFKRELRYSRRVEAVQAPPTMLGIRRSLLQGRRRVDRAISATKRRLSRTDHPDADLVNSLNDHVARIVVESNGRFARVGIACRTRR